MYDVTSRVYAEVESCLETRFVGCGDEYAAYVRSTLEVTLLTASQLCSDECDVTAATICVTELNIQREFVENFYIPRLPELPSQWSSKQIDF